jgi:serine/threonine-protein kinase
MGEVYRAHDSRLGRDVAIKLLPAAFTHDADRLARFEREARVVAALNHPNIGVIYGVEEATAADGGHVRALVLELVEGETLAARVARGPIPAADAVRLAIQIASALEAAHDKGIVHRDLKPANILITPDGEAKVVDFGLAAAGPHEANDQSLAPTMSADRTDAGLVLGTAPYMSPEQARGQTLDKRTDIWAFGCVLMEMITGRRAFAGETTSDTIAKILEREPDWSALPPSTPPAVHRVLRRTLVKDVKARLRDIGDARLELQDPSPRPDQDVQPPPRPRHTWRWAVASLLALTVGAAIGAAGAWRRPTAKAPQHVAARFALPMAADETFARNVAISPDGRYAAYVAGPVGTGQLHLRGLVNGDSRVVAETDDAYPFFSPDSQWLGFFDGKSLKKQSVQGGSPIVLAPAPASRGGTWASDGTIVFAPEARGGLWRVSADGTDLRRLTSPDSSRGETSHRLPSLVGDGSTVVYTAEGDNYGDRSLESVSTQDGSVRVLARGVALGARYVPTGHLTYVDGNRLVAVPFDRSAVRITGAPVTLLDNVRSYSFTSDGTLIYGDAAPDTARDARLVWVSRDGDVQPLRAGVGVYDYPRLSPDGSHIVVDKQMGADRSLFMYDVERDAFSKFTFGNSNNWPLWSPDGTRVIYGSNRVGTQWDVYSKPADGAAPEHVLVTGGATQIPRAISPQGDVLAYSETRPEGTLLFALPFRAGAAARRLFPDGGGEMMPTFSRDGRWIAYVSSDSGRREVYVRSSDGTGSKWQISSGGGTEPVWSFDGGELFYRTADTMFVVEVTSSGTSFSFGKARALFTGSYLFGATEGQEYDVTRDGKRFLMLKPEKAAAAAPLKVIVNWFEEVRRKVSTSG